MEPRSNKIFKVIISFEIIISVCLLILFYYLNSNNNELKNIIDNIENKISKFDEYEEIDKNLSFYQNIDLELENKYNEYYDNISLLEKKINDGKTDVKIAYLTFDDGPYDLTSQVLDKLKENNIRATFFVLGKNGYDETYRRIVREGHTLGNHTYYHNIGKGLYNSADGFMDQVNKLENYLFDLTGYRTTLVRFPGGSDTAGELKEPIVNKLHEKGYNYVEWTCETGDGSSKKLSQKDTYSWFIDTLGNQKIMVLLMHDYNHSTFNDLQRIIDYLKNNNYIFLPLNNKSVMVN